MSNSFSKFALAYCRLNNNYSHENRLGLNSVSKKSQALDVMVLEVPHEHHVSTRTLLEPGYMRTRILWLEPATMVKFFMKSSSKSLWVSLRSEEACKLSEIRQLQQLIWPICCAIFRNLRSRSARCEQGVLLELLRRIISAWWFVYMLKRILHH